MITSRTSRRMFLAAGLACAMTVGRSQTVALIGRTNSRRLLRLFATGHSSAIRNPIDQEYTEKIKEYTTETFFTSPLVDYLPASKTCRRRRRCSATSPARPASCRTRRKCTSTCACSRRRRPRVKVYSIGTTEEGREMIAVAVASEALMAQARREPRATREARGPAHDQDGRRGRRTSSSTASVAGLLHHRHDPFAGNRLANGADGARLPAGGRRQPVHRNIRDNVITLITPVVEVDGRDRMVDIYNWHLANPDKTGRRCSTGASTSRTTTIATRWA